MILIFTKIENDGVPAKWAKDYYPKLKCHIIFSVIGNILFLKNPSWIKRENLIPYNTLPGTTNKVALTGRNLSRPQTSLFHGGANKWRTC